MKKSFLLLLLFGLFFWRVLESSADSPDENRQGTLTVTLFYEEEKTAVEGAGLEFIEVADLKFSEGQVSYSLLPDFAESSLKLEGMKASEALLAAKKLQALCQQKGKTGFSARTDENGKALFENLKPGMYLIWQSSSEKTAKRFEKIDPYLVSVPQGEKISGKMVWDYEVKTLPKVELVLKNTPESEPPRQSQPLKKVKTGDETKIVAYLLLAGASAMILLKAKSALCCISAGFVTGMEGGQNATRAGRNRASSGFLESCRAGTDLGPGRRLGNRTDFFCRNFLSGTVVG